MNEMKNYLVEEFRKTCDELMKDMKNQRKIKCIEDELEDRENLKYEKGQKKEDTCSLKLNHEMVNYDNDGKVKETVENGEVGQVVRQLMKEEQDRQRRMKNVIIFRAPESKKSLPKERENEDINFCQKLMKNGLNIQVNIEKVIRLGKKDEAKDRPMLVKLTNRNVRSYIVKNSWRLAAAGEYYKNIYIVPDMPSNERARRKNREFSKNDELEKYKAPNRTLAQFFPDEKYGRQGF